MPPVVKICGLRSVEAALKAMDSGADMLGVIMVPNRKRTIPHDVAKKIAEKARIKRKHDQKKFVSAKALIHELSTRAFASHNDYFNASAQLLRENGPFLVGVFRNQKIDDVFRLAKECCLDFIQLHGSEDVQEYLDHNESHEFCIIKRYVIPDQIELMGEFFPKVVTLQNQGFILPLLDSEAGGEGKTIDWLLINDLDGQFILAGGLNPDNLQETKPFLKNVVGFDVSGGVEDEDGEKNLGKIEAFVLNAKAI